MVYRFEKDDARAEVRQDVAGVIVFWPKIDGHGNVALSEDAGANTVTLFRANGDVIAGETELAPTTVDDVARIDIAIPAIAELGEDYFAVVKFTPDVEGEDYARVAQIQFDVVLQPWGDSWISLHDLEAEVSTVRARLQRQVEAHDPDGTAELTVGQWASQHAYRAHTELYRRIRDRLPLERSKAISNAISTGGPVYPADHYARPRLIVDRRALRPTELALCLAMIFEHDISDGEQANEAERLADRWHTRANELFAQLTDLAYDFSQDRVPERAIEKLSSVVMTRRVQSR